jgi:hypothetical protein
VKDRLKEKIKGLEDAIVRLKRSISETADYPDEKG